MGDLSSKLKENILDILFPVFCIGCGKEGNYICDECKIFTSENALICPVCQKASFGGERHSYCSGKNGLDGLVSIWDYEGVVKKLLLKIKYDGIFHAVGEFVEKAFIIIANDEVRYKEFISFLKNVPTSSRILDEIGKNINIAYVPLYIKKEKQRGFNQSEMIAKEISKITNFKTVNLLKKTRETKSQTELDIKERAENVKDSFTLLRPGLNKTENVLLVDDIWTTGATMKECCKVLKIAGVKNVWGFTLARAV